MKLTNISQTRAGSTASNQGGTPKTAKETAALAGHTHVVLVRYCYSVGTFFAPDDGPVYIGNEEECRKFVLRALPPDSVYYLHHGEMDAPTYKMITLAKCSERRCVAALRTRQPQNAWEY